MKVATDTYRPIAKLGTGGMASVELAVMHGAGGINKLVVIKKILADLAKDPGHVAMFMNEARVAARLSHPNVVSTHGVGGGAENELPFIVMEYLQGQSLSVLLKRLGRPRVSLALQLHVIRGVLAGLEHAHTLLDFDGRPLGLVHRDVSPQNAFVCYDGRVKLLDFGVVKIDGLGGDHKPGSLKGKLAYMAPEQLAGTDVDARADVFSVGVMLWEALAGRRFAKGDSAATQVKKPLREALPPPEGSLPPVPAAFEELCFRALAPAREDRFASAGAMLSALDEAIAATGTQLDERALGAFVTSSFAEERARLQAAIESQLKSFTLAQAGSPDGSVFPDVETPLPSLSEATSRDDLVPSLLSLPPSASASASHTPSGRLAGEVSDEKPRRRSLLKMTGAMAVVALLGLVGTRALMGVGGVGSSRGELTRPTNQPAARAALSPPVVELLPSSIASGAGVGARSDDETAPSPPKAASAQPTAAELVTPPEEAPRPVVPKAVVTSKQPVAPKPALRSKIAVQTKTRAPAPASPSRKKVTPATTVASSSSVARTMNRPARKARDRALDEQNPY